MRPVPRARLYRAGLYADAPRHAERRWLVCDACSAMAQKEGTAGLLHTPHERVSDGEWRCTRCLATRTW